MKKTIAGLAVVASMFFSLSAFAKEATTTLKVEGWHCAACSGKTASALKGVKGVEKVDASKEKGVAVVTYDDAKVTVAQLEAAVKDSGFKVAK